MRQINLSGRLKLILAAIVALAGFFLSSCGKNDCLKSAGKQTKEVRELEAFKQVEIYNVFNVYLKSDTVNQVTIEAGENLLENIETSVVDGVLTIRDQNTCDFVKGYAPKNLYISVDTLSEVIIHDGVRLYTIDTLEFNTLKIKFLSQIGYCDLLLNGYSFQLQVWYASGDFKLGGKAKYSYLDCEELAFFYAEELETDFCNVFQNSMGDCYVKTNGELKVQIEDSGNIYYSGVPSEIIMADTSGTGKLIKKE